MRIFMGLVAGLAILGILAYFFLFKEERDKPPFGFSTIIEMDENGPQTCGTNYLGHARDKTIVYKVSASTHIFEDALILAFEVSALHITDSVALTGDEIKVTQASLQAVGQNTAGMLPPGGEETGAYIAILPNPGDRAALPLEFLNGSEFIMTLEGEAETRKRHLPRAPDEVADKVFDCFAKLQSRLEKAAAPTPE